MVSVVDNSKPSPEVMQGPVKREMDSLSSAIYEAGRYMLLMNKKKGD